MLQWYKWHIICLKLEKNYLLKGGGVMLKSFMLALLTCVSIGSIAYAEDCVSFSNRNAEVSKINGRWKIVDGNHWLFDFAGKRDEAYQALRVIKYYRMNQSCFVGRPNPSFTYMLISSRAPAGSYRGEDCIGFNNANLSVVRAGRRNTWKLVDGSHWIVDFDYKKAEAYQALKIVKKHKFSQVCYVGRPGPSFTYWKR